MDHADRKRKAADFAKRWSGRGYEKGETASFWLELLSAIGIEHPTETCVFEQRTRDGGFIDAWMPDLGVLVEQKSLGVDLDKPEERQGRLVTPYQQALSYAQQMPLSQQPRWILVSDFATIRVHDRDKADPERDYETVRLSDLSKDMKLLPLNTGVTPRAIREKEASIKAGELVGKLHAALSAQYVDPESKSSQHALNVLCVRLVFCLYAEDSGLFGKDVLLNYLRPFDAAHMRRAILDLFEVLDTPIAERDPYISPDLAVFPYVNGGLFRGEVEVPNFTEDIKTLLLLEVSMKTDWSTISPTIFGGVFESTLNPETRRSGGMHYTSPENIHKVIDPLFLDGLKAEYRAIKEDVTMGDKRRKDKLSAFQSKLSSLRFLDPASGSGNFLTETYMSLRRLENLVLADLMNIRGKDRSVRQFTENQMAFGFETDDAGDAIGVKVNIGQFYGIEINDFAVSVAKTALWIAEIQANMESEYVIQQDIENLPLRDSANIVCGNALRTDWNDVLPAEKCDYIMGNPPFLGSSVRSKSQTDDLELVFGNEKKWGKCDYCVGWYKKSADYMLNTQCCSALVSTNSITQGEQVEPTWRRLFESGVVINFAYRTFVWDNEATDKAHVHCVIIGFSYSQSTEKKTLFDSDGIGHSAGNINGYLLDAPNVFIEGRGKPLNQGWPKMVQGCKPVDGGNLVLTPEEKANLEAKYPVLKEVIHPYLGAREFINGKERYCLWFEGAQLDRYAFPEILERLEAVRTMRLSSPTKAFRDAAETPALFVERRKPETAFLAFPEVSSGNRRILPIGYLGSDVVPSNQLHFIPTDSLYAFGLLSSKFHMVWVRAVAGRLKSDYRYNPSVYNSFIFPNASPEQQSRIESISQSILDLRNKYSERSLAELYDPRHELVFPDLMEAHRALDAAVEAAYGVDFKGDEEKIVAHLFKLYAELTAE